MEDFKEFLHKHGVTQQSLARELGITYQALYVKLNGKGCFSIKQALACKKFLRLTEEEFEKFFG